MKNKLVQTILILLAVLAVASIVVFSLFNVKLCTDDTTNTLLTDVVQRALLSAFLILLVASSKEYSSLLVPSKIDKSYWLAVPCFLVVIANFPFFALASGTAVVSRFDILWLFLLQCLLVGVIEELFFRCILQKIFFDKLQNRSVFLKVVLCSAIFGLWHLVNLLFGGGFAATLLQVGYSFLIGAMLCTLTLVTSNIWLAVTVHALFDVGGTIVSSLGSGNPQDVGFWVLTAVCGMICFVCVFLVLFRIQKQQCKKSETNSLPN